MTAGTAPRQVSFTISFKEMKLIPTRNKSKLPKSMSYPLGAKEISEALAEVPQYNELSVTFIDRSTFWASKFNESIKNKEQIQVVEINYTRLKGGISTPKKWLEEGYPYSGWNIKIYAVPKENRHQANAALKAIVLPRLKEWLIDIGPIEDFSYHQKSFGLELSTCEIKEMK